MTPHNAEAFRARYRAEISPWYNAWLHGGFVLAYGLATLAVLIGQIEHLRLLDWLAVPAGLVVFNVGEYTIHRWWGHHKQKVGGLFYARHTGDHHSFFVETNMTFEQAKDWRVIFFPAWLIVVYSLFVCLPAWLVVSQVFNTDVAALFSATMMLGYLMYEFFHACQHLPRTHWLLKLPWLRETAHLHRLHHRREIMRQANFNLVYPLTDWLFGTLYWEPMNRTSTATSDGLGSVQRTEQL